MNDVPGPLEGQDPIGVELAAGEVGQRRERMQEVSGSSHDDLSPEAYGLREADGSELEVAVSDCVVQVGQAQLDAVKRIVERNSVVSGGPAVTQLPIG